MKRFLSAVLAGAIALGMAMTASANALAELRDQGGGDIRGPVTSRQIASINEKAFPDVMYQVDITLDGDQISVDDLSDLEVSPGSEVRVYLSPFMFLSDDNTSASGNLNDALPVSALHHAGISVRESLLSNADVAEISLEGNSRSAYISIVFTNAPGHSDHKFNYSVFLARGTRRSSATRFTVKGVIRTDEVETESHGDSIDISGGQVVAAKKNLKGVKLYLGESMYITANMTRGRKYSGMATTDVSRHDADLFGDYDELEYIYTVKTIGGLNAEGNHVTFELDDKYYVYNSSGTYIGTTDGRLRYSTKYYLTTRHYPSLEVW